MAMYNSMPYNTFRCLSIVLTSTLILAWNTKLPSISFTQWNWRTQKLAQVSSIIVATTLGSQAVLARPEGVNRPDLLPNQYVPVIDVANFLSKGQEKKIITSIEKLEKATGFKLRLLCQSYPNTPGLAIKDFWKVDDNTIVFVADKGEGFNRKGIPTNIINLNIGKNVDDTLPPIFWQRLTNKLGNQPYVKENGADIAVMNAVEAITYCLEEKECKDIPFQL